MNKLVAENYVEELMEIFWKYNSSEDDKIDAKKLLVMMRAVGDEPTEAEVYDCLHAYDKDEDQMINLSEFLKVMTQRMHDIESVENLHNAFEVFDRHSRAEFDALDLRMVMRQQGEIISYMDSEILISELDTTGSTRITLKEFLAFMQYL